MPDKFSLSDNNGLQVGDHGNGCLQSVNQIDISGGYYDVTLGNIGGSQNNGIDINTNEIQTLNISGITVSENSAIRMQLNVNEAQIGVQTASGEVCQGVSGGIIDIDASLCNGMCRIDNMQATQSIDYVGGDNGDYQYADDDTGHTGRNFGDVVTVTRLGANSGSNFELGGGSDTLFIHLANTQSAGEMAEANVTLGAGSDFLGVGQTSGLLRVNVKDYASEDEMSVMQGNLDLDEAKVQDFFARFGMEVAEEDVTLFEVAVAENGSSTAVEYNDDVYLFDPSGSGRDCLKICVNLKSLAG